MRINVVGKAKKDAGTCVACLQTVEAGSPYSYVKPRYGPRRVKHMSCRPWRASETTSNDRLSRLYQAQEAVEDATIETAADALNDAAEVAREVAEEYRESATNIEEGFGHGTAQSEELAEQGDECDQWAEALEALAGELGEEGHGYDEYSIADVVGSLPL